MHVPVHATHTSITLDISYLTYTHILWCVVAGSVTAYSVLVRNSGNVPLRDLLLVVDALSGHSTNGSIACALLPDATSWAPGSDLAAQAELNCTGSYTFDQAAIEAGDIHPVMVATAANLAAPVQAQLPSIGVTATANMSVAIAASCLLPHRAGAWHTNVPGQRCQLALIQLHRAPHLQPALTHCTCTCMPLHAGAEVQCSITVTNTGNLGLRQLQLQGMSGNASCLLADGARLEPGASTDCSASWLSSQDDFESGSMHVPLSASAQPISSASANSPPLLVAAPATTLALPVVRSLSLSMRRTKGDDEPLLVVAAGHTLHLDLTVNNTGNVHLADLDLVLLPGLSCSLVSGGNASLLAAPPSELLVGQALECNGTFTYSQDDLEQGDRTFMATATATGVSQQAANVLVQAALSSQLQLDVDGPNCTTAPEGGNGRRKQCLLVREGLNVLFRSCMHECNPCPALPLVLAFLCSHFCKLPGRAAQHRQRALGQCQLAVSNGRGKRLHGSNPGPSSYRQLPAVPRGGAG